MTSRLKKHKCDKCKYATNRKDHLKKHVDGVHLKLKPFKCQSCEYRCRDIGHLKKHVDAVHLKLKPFPCPYDMCNHRCSHKQDLNKHINAVHLKLKPFKCPHSTCKYQCSTQGNLDTHVLLRHEGGAAADELRQRNNKRHRERYDTDDLYAITKRLRSRMHHAIDDQGACKSDTTMALLGCTPKQARAHIESQFAPGMSWDNRSEWHIDHTRPCASFDLEDESEQRVCFHYSNLQPLWAADNLAKGSLYQGKRRRTQRVQ